MLQDRALAQALAAPGLDSLFVKDVPVDGGVELGRRHAGRLREASEEVADLAPSYPLGDLFECSQPAV
jgi:hypothetical protein